MQPEINKHHWERGLIASVIILIALALAACGEAKTPETSSPFADQTEAAIQPPPPLDASEVALGKQVYAANCAACHGENAEGQPDWKVQRADGYYPAPPHTVDGHTWHHGDVTLFTYIKKGGDGLNIPNFKSNMPAFESTLTDEEIIAVITYLKSLWPEEQRRIQFEVSQQNPLPSQ